MEMAAWWAEPGVKAFEFGVFAVTDRGDEPVFIVGLFCIPFFIDGKGVVKEAVFVLELDVMIYFESGSPFLLPEQSRAYHRISWRRPGGNVRGLTIKELPVPSWRLPSL